ncbi:hypothetical protein Hamer_G008773 [Homarus americanus]|uniref:Uncharacterized protein n=1 Tax=Homarus americanus TaxID=6706 RepID=A0A8J5JMB3_HOMAM|nr:hypothetical protein Hamer_G008773 [Homarus americanus]
MDDLHQLIEVEVAGIIHDVLYLDAMSELVYWCHARWVTVHPSEKAKLPTEHPDVAMEFKAGNFTVQKTRKCSQSSHEQNNALFKGDGGTVDLTDNPSAFAVGWLLDQRGSRADFRHSDQTPSVQTAFAEDVRSLVNVIEDHDNLIGEESVDMIDPRHQGNCRSCSDRGCPEYKDDWPGAVQVFHQRASGKKNQAH